MKFPINVFAKHVVEFRSMPSLLEQRNNLLDEADNLLKKSKEESRAFSDEESQRFNDIKSEVTKIDKTLAAEADALKFGEKRMIPTKTEERAAIEHRVFANYIRGVVSEERADVNMTTSDNGAVIPKSIAKKIISKVYDLSPIYQLSTRYNVGGSLTIPYYDEDTQQITMAYADEFVELESTSGKFTSITLTGFLAGALTKISKKLLNNNDFDLVNFIIQKVSEAAIKWIEKELLNGTTSKIAGLSGVTQTITAASATVITADELIDVQEEVPDVFQSGAIWIMNRKTRKSIRKLKDADGNYLLNKDVSAKWGYTLLGKDVYTSDNMSLMATGNTVIYYGDMSGLAVKVAEDVNIEVLREKFATQHAIGVVAWLEMDSKVENAQKISKLKMA